MCRVGREKERERVPRNKHVTRKDGVSFVSNIYIFNINNKIMWFFVSFLYVAQQNQVFFLSLLYVAPVVCSRPAGVVPPVNKQHVLAVGVTMLKRSRNVP